MKEKYFKYRYGKLPLPVFFPDATRGVVRSIDTSDLEATKTKGILVNTYHLYREFGEDVVKDFGGIGKLMDFSGAIISDSGGFQVGSLIKKDPKFGYINDFGAHFRQENGSHIVLTPELSIRFQLSLGVDMVVALDDFDAPNATFEENKETVERTLRWAERSKTEFDKVIAEMSLSSQKKPYLLGVVQGGRSRELRKYCIDGLTQIGFDGLGYGGEEKVKGSINYDLAEFIAENTPKNYLLYALGVGKPDNVLNMAKLGYDIFDCVLPTRDARHGRLYVYNFDSIDEINLEEQNFYSYFNPNKKKHSLDTSPVSSACDCVTCTRYSKAYLHHLFKIGDYTAGRLATIHNLRFYSLLVEKIGKSLKR